MMELMAGPLGLVLVIAVMWWGITFNQRLKERYHCTACTFWGVTGGVVGTFCWMLLLGNRVTWESLLAGAIAAVVTLALFASNRTKSGSTLQGILMTVWQLFVGLAVFLILGMLDSEKKKRK